MMRFVMYWALAGILVPVAILTVDELQGVFQWPYLAVALWPSSILTMAIQEGASTSFKILVLAISIGVNVVLYSAVGTAVWLLWSLYDRLFNSH
jgi:hypothetical protein